MRLLRLFPLATRRALHSMSHAAAVEEGESSLLHIYAISDLHVDYSKNKEFVSSWHRDSYSQSGLIVAGDVTDSFALLETTLTALKEKFKLVFFVPGNHELWLRGQSEPQFKDSIDKFNKILAMCDRIGVKTRPTKCTMSAGGGDVWVVPLYSWYCKPEEEESDSLHMSPSSGAPENVASMEKMWMDNLLCSWEHLLPPAMTKSRYFAALNEPFLSVHYSAPVISFSHFVPAQELILANDADRAAVERERRALGLKEAPPFQGAARGFNFTRYAGSRVLEEQIQRLRPALHVFGHQHRNRDRAVRGVRYVSHCLGNVREQAEGWVWGVREWAGPKQIWPTPVTASTAADT